MTKTLRTVAALGGIIAAECAAVAQPLEQEIGDAGSEKAQRRAAALAHASAVFAAIDKLRDRDTALLEMSNIAAQVCRRDKLAGIELFKRLNLRVERERVLKGIGAVAASRGLACDPSLTGELEDRGLAKSLDATTKLEAASLGIRGGHPADDIRTAIGDAAERFPFLDHVDMLRFVTILGRYRESSKEQADAIFRRTLDTLAGNPEIARQGLFTLGNYLFRPEGASPYTVRSLPLGNGADMRMAYSLSEVRPGADAALVAEYLKAAAPQLAVGAASPAERLLTKALAFQLLPHAEAHLPGATGNLRMAAGLLSGQQPSAEDQALFNRFDPAFDRVEEDLAERADRETDPRRKDQLLFSLIMMLSETGRAGEAQRRVRDISNRETRAALGDLVAYKVCEHLLRERRVDDARVEIANVGNPLYAAILALALAASGGDGIDVETAAPVLDAIGRLDLKYRPALMAGAASLLAARNPEFAIEVIRGTVEAWNQRHDAPLEPKDTPDVVTVTLDSRGAMIRFHFGDRPAASRIQPVGLPPLSIAGAIGAMRAANPVVLAEIAGALTDENERGRALASVAIVDLEQAFEPKPRRSTVRR